MRMKTIFSERTREELSPNENDFLPKEHENSTKQMKSILSEANR